MQGGCSPGQAGTPGPQEAAAPEPGYGAQEGQTSLAQHPPLPGVPAPGREAAKGLPWGPRVNLGRRSGGQEGPSEVTAPHWALWPGRGAGPCLLEMLDLLRAEPWQEWPPLLPGPFHPVLGHLPPTASPQALSPEFRRNPAILRPLCQAGRLLKELPPPGLCRLAAPRARKAQSHHQALFTGDILELSRTHTRPRAPAPSLQAPRLPSPRLSRQGCHLGMLLHLLCSSSSIWPGGKVVLPGALGFALYWPLSLSCWYSLCSPDGLF